MRGSNWIQFSWELDQLSSTPPPLDKRYLVNFATEADATLLDAAIARSYSMEHAWSTDLEARVALARQMISEDLSSGRIDFLVVRHGARIIAAAPINPSVESQSNFPVGICVLNEYRSRGIGSFLLYKSLQHLKEKGLKTAHVLTRRGVTAERFLYPKFGSIKSALTVEPV